MNASPFLRLGAGLIDLALLIPLITAAVLLTNEALRLPVTPEWSLLGWEVKMDDWAEAHFWELVALYSGVKVLVAGTYFVAFESSSLQATPGKRCLHLMVVDQRGARMRVGRSGGRKFRNASALEWFRAVAMPFDILGGP